MATTQRMTPVGTASPTTGRPQRRSGWRRRIRNHLRTIFVRGDFTSLVITCSLMIVTALAVDAAAWTPGLGILPAVSPCAVVLGFLLARSQFSELTSLLMSTIYSAAIIAAASAHTLIQSGSLRQRISVLASELRIWFEQALDGQQPANDDTVFVLFLAVLFWYLGHNSAWHIFRVDRVWRVIIPVGLVLLTNQLYYQGDANLNLYLALFTILALLLLIRSHIDSREYDWYMHRVSFPNYVRRTFFQAGSLLALVIVVVAWVVPTGQDDKSLERINDLASGKAFSDLAEIWNRLFSSLEAQGIATADYYGGDELQLSGAIRLGDQPVMTVEAPYGPRYYWRSTVYDTYNFGNWRWSHIRTVRAYTDEPGLELNIGQLLPGARQDVRQTFSMLVRSSELVYAAPQPVALGLPVEAELDCINDFGRQCVNNNEPTDVAIIRTRDRLRQGDTYSVTSSISTASATDLRTAGQNYPDWVLRLYLQGANAMPARVRDLAVQIIAQSNAQTPYDRAKAIERWLRTNIQYNEAIPTPPQDRDPIEWFLFEQREGYCNYYATAMVLMLRSQGIPARMAAGFAQGMWDPEHSAFLVRERDAHTWVEVYFPGYGWVEFEPTADEAPLDREGDEIPQTVLPTTTPLPSPTALPTATPTLSPPTQEGGANATPTSPAEVPVVPSTPTPTPSPSPTPPPPPDITRVDSDGGPDVLRLILITLGLFVLVVVALVAVVLFMIWYVEYRGLGGLNNIQRAYARLAIYSNWLGLKFDRSATPDERRRFLVDEVPEGEHPINTITHIYVQNRYAAPNKVQPLLDQDTVSATTAWKEARGVFIRRKIAQFFGRTR